MDGNQEMGPAKPSRKICIVTPEFPPHQWGGLARTVERVARHAASMGLEVHVACFLVLDGSYILLDENRETHTFGVATVHRLTVGKERLADAQRQLWDCPHTLTLQMMYQSLEILHREQAFDLFHSFFLYPVGYITGLLARRVGVPTLATLVGNDVKRYLFSPEKVATCRSGLDNADRVVGLSQDLLEMADALFPIKAKGRVIFNSVAQPEQEWRHRVAPGEPWRLGCAGIFKYAKGLPYLFKSLAILRKRHGVTLELLGTLRDSEQETFGASLQGTGIGDLVRFCEAIPHEQVHAWLMGLDAFVLPSVSEGCPNILMEAMACGLPCVATRTGANDVLIEDRVSGLLVPWGHAGALAEALEQILDNPGLGASLGRAARLRMREFSADQERHAWESVYRELIEF
jgi:L-malate glycosyltransferase